ncbi:MAG: hypothetical protein HZB43_04255 [candidate division Zixibacteria bacterium]|nr:hypothetical protein [candidate division Zixibacteria bacterium]
MNLRQLPKWVRWVALAITLWSVWGLALRPIFTRRINVAQQQHADCDRQVAAIKERMGEVPTVLRAVDSCHRVLDSCLTSFGSSRDIDGLASVIRQAGQRLGLERPQAEPELPSLLKVARSTGGPVSGGIRLDTLVFAVSAKGSFFNLGAWLDDIERRPDFRTWNSCEWSRSDDGEQVAFTGKAVLLTLDDAGPGESRRRAGL